LTTQPLVQGPAEQAGQKNPLCWVSSQMVSMSLWKSQLGSRKMRAKLKRKMLSSHSKVSAT